MAGLIQKQMVDQGMPPQEAPESEVSENDPNFQAAIQYAMQVLYEKGAAKDIAAQVRAAQGNPVEGIANIAYEITSVVDEKTEGAVPDELLVPLAMQILEEVVEISEAAGIKLAPADVAGAFKQMILRYLGEQGVDTTELQQAMDQVDPSVFEQAQAEETEQEPV
jgi:hypothetical protein